MRLSELLPEYLPEYSYKIINEKEFDVLGLTFTSIDQTVCTFAVNKNYADLLSSNVSMVFVDETNAKAFLDVGVGICIVKKPREVFFKLHNALVKGYPQYTRKKKKSIIGKNCKISNLAVISDYNVVIGDNVTIDEFVVIRDNVIIGDNVIIRSGVKIGEPDFEFKFDDNGIFGVEHCGGVVIGNDVEVLSNTGINKALYPWDDTVIGHHTKIDMLCNVSHGAKIGSNTMIVALSGIGGRTIVGNNCWIGYGSILRNGIKIGDNARVNMGAVVSQSVNENSSVTGNFAIDHVKFMENLKKKA